MKKSEIREMIREEVKKLNEAHWHPKDNILDNITFEELITTVESNEKIIDEKSITKVFDDLMKAFEKQVNHFADIKIKGNNIIEKLYAKYMPAPFLSLLIDDCINNGMDYHAGGARYNTSYIQGVGLGSITDSLASIKYNVFDKKLISLKHLVKVLNENFKGNEALRERFTFETPKYGNDNDYADNITKKIFEIFYNAVDGRPNTRGGCHRINLLPTTVHIYFGKLTGAMPDGRKNANDFSIGIELIYTKSDSPNNAQYTSLILLTKSLREKYNIPLTNIVAHDVISPNREDDPANFDWEKFKQEL